MMRHLGLHTHRLRTNPEEKRFAKNWAAWNEARGTNPPYVMVDELLAGLGGMLTHRDHVVAATVIQWLGSPVGLTFLEQLGYRKDTGPAKPSKATSLSKVRCHTLMERIRKSLSELSSELQK